jgi:hypothetical protein
MELVSGYDEAVADWAGRQLGVKFVQPLKAFGILNGKGQAVGAAVFNDYYKGGNVEWTHVGPGTIRPKLMRELARYVFIDLDCSRVTAKTARKNVPVSRLLTNAGFTFEGSQKRYFGPTAAQDAMVYVLFRENAARWLGER